MANSIQTFGDRFTRHHDAELQIAVCTMLDCAFEMQLPASLNLVILEWRANTNVWGPGCIDLELDSIADDTESVDAFLALVQAAVERLSARDGFVSAEYVNSCLKLHGALERPSMSVHLVATVLRDLFRLVAARELLEPPQHM